MRWFLWSLVGAFGLTAGVEAQQPTRTILDGVGNGRGNTIVIDNPSDGSTTILRNTRNGVGNRVIITNGIGRPLILEGNDVVCPPLQPPFAGVLPWKGLGVENQSWLWWVEWALKQQHALPIVPVDPIDPLRRVRELERLLDDE